MGVGRHCIISSIQSLIFQMEKPSYSKRSIILISWASVATALLLVVLIGGGIYLGDVKNDYLVIFKKITLN